MTFVTRGIILPRDTNIVTCDNMHGLDTWQQQNFEKKLKNKIKN